MTSKARIAIFASGSGTNAEEIFNYFKNHPLSEVVLLLSNNPDAYVLERANKHSINSMLFTKAQFRESEEVLNELKKAGVTHIV
ncbi:MAG: phosphoribosylglycinamide formyltransferase, partial [Bacteroidia bacterium]|nr:phosphoribosylglycinamide formyltransferase [Bacteroidia bacterium]